MAVPRYRVVEFNMCFITFEIIELLPSCSCPGLLFCTWDFHTAYRGEGGAGIVQVRACMREAFPVLRPGIRATPHLVRSCEFTTKYVINLRGAIN